MLEALRVMLTIVGVVFLVYAYLIGKKEKLNWTLLSEEQFGNLHYKKELARDIAMPLIVESTILVGGSMLLGKSTVMNIIIIVVMFFVSLCVYALEKKIGRSLYKYNNVKGKIKKNKKDDK